MPIFVVIATRDSDAVGEHIGKLSNAHFYEIKKDTWVVSFNGTTRELAEIIQIRQAESTSAGIVFSVDNFSGKHRPELWEWLKLHSDGGGV